MTSSMTSFPVFAKVVVQRCGFHHWIAQRISWGEVVSIFLYLLYFPSYEISHKLDRWSLRSTVHLGKYFQLNRMTLPMSVRVFSIVMSHVLYIKER